MDKELFNLIISQIPNKLFIHLQEWGEPLLHPDTLCHMATDASNETSKF